MTAASEIPAQQELARMVSTASEEVHVLEGYVDALDMLCCCEGSPGVELSYDNLHYLFRSIKAHIGAVRDALS